MATKLKWMTVVLAAAACAAIAGAAAPRSQAGLLTCPGGLQPFAQFGDGNDYFGFANNGFENGSSGWSLSGASIGSGNEPWGVNGGGRSSLSIGPGGTASSPRVCAALFAPHWRMFAHANGANGSLKAQIVFYGLLGNVTGLLNFTSFGPSDYGTWAAELGRPVRPRTPARDLLRSAPADEHGLERHLAGRRRLRRPLDEP